MEIFETIKHNPSIFYLLAAVFGLCVGSFLNLVIYRLPIMLDIEWAYECKDFLESKGINIHANLLHKQTTRVNLFFPNSFCTKCSHKITWWQNIPVLSYLILQGKCYNCKDNISPAYPLIELLTSALTLIAAMVFGFSAQFLLVAITTWFFIPMFFIDLKLMILPDELTLSLMWIGLIASCFKVFVNPSEAIIGAALGYSSLWLMVKIFYILTGKHGMGNGDFKLFAAFGALMGYKVLPFIIFGASLIGIIFAVVQYVYNKKDLSAPMPFGPSLIICGYAVLYNQGIVNNYLKLFAI